MTVQEMIECLQQVRDKTALFVFADGDDVVAVYDCNSRVIITDTEGD